MIQDGSFAIFAITTVLGCVGALIPSIVEMVIRKELNQKSNLVMKQLKESNPLLFQNIMKLVNREDASQKLLASEMAIIRKQMKGINMVDQFAMYAKLKRRLNALTDKYKEKMNARTTANQKVRMCIQITLQTVVGISCMWLVYQHRSFPVVSLDPDLLWPIGGILAMPSCQAGEISVLVWLGMTRTVSRKLSQYIANVRQSAANAASLDPLSIALD